MRGVSLTGGCLPGRGGLLAGGSPWWGGGSLPDRVGLLCRGVLPGGLPGRGSPWQDGLPGRGESPCWGVSLAGGLPGRGDLPACTEADPPTLVDRQTPVKT